MVGLFCHMKDPDWPLLLLPLQVWGQLWPASSFFSSASDKKGWSLCSDPNSGIRSGLSVHPCLFVFPFYFCETFFPRPSLFTSILRCLKMIVEVETLSMDGTTNLSTNGSGTGKDGFRWLNIRIIRIRIRLKCKYGYPYPYSNLIWMSYGCIWIRF